MSEQPSLVERMRELAKSRTDLPADWLEKADTLEAAINGFYGQP